MTLAPYSVRIREEARPAFGAALSFLIGDGVKFRRESATQIGGRASPHAIRKMAERARVSRGTVEALVAGRRARMTHQTWLRIKGWVESLDREVDRNVNRLLLDRGMTKRTLLEGEWLAALIRRAARLEEDNPERARLLAEGTAGMQLLSLTDQLKNFWGLSRTVLIMPSKKARKVGFAHSDLVRERTAARPAKHR